MLVTLGSLHDRQTGRIDPLADLLGRARATGSQFAETTLHGRGGLTLGAGPAPLALHVVRTGPLWLQSQGKPTRLGPGDVVMVRGGDAGRVLCRALPAGYPAAATACRAAPRAGGQPPRRPRSGECCKGQGGRKVGQLVPPFVPPVPDVLGSQADKEQVATQLGVRRAGLVEQVATVLAPEGVGAVSMYLGFFAWYRGLAIGPITTVSQVQVVQPVLSITWATLLLSEQLT